MENKPQMKIPTHLAIILDGNGRWAKKRGLARTLGHKQGTETLKDICDVVFDMGVKYLSVYCFSTENWKREKKEVDFLFKLLPIYFSKFGYKFVERDTRAIFSGDISMLPKKAREACYDIVEKTKNCKSHILNFCFNYGSYDEITRAVKMIVDEVNEGKLNKDDITPDTITNHLYTKDMPPVDLLIRTSNEQRLSNFMLWQLSYAELYFTPVYWPDFKQKDLEDAFVEFARRDRRFGGVSESEN